MNVNLFSPLNLALVAHYQIWNYQHCHQNLYDFFFYILTKSAHLISPFMKPHVLLPTHLNVFVLLYIY